MPRAALLSLYARVEGVEPSTWDDPSLIQLWGPRYLTYVVAEREFALFSFGRLPESWKGRERAERMAERVRAHLDGARVVDRELGQALGIHPNALRYAAPTGTVAIRWGARAPIVWSVPDPEIDPADARRELARRYLHVFGPATADRFARWAGMRAEPAAPAPARLLPSGDSYWLLDGAERALLVEREELRQQLWTPRVWPGALLVEGEIRGTWRRKQHTVRVDTWERRTPAMCDAVEAEAAAMPLPGVDRPIEVVRSDGA